MDPQVLKLQEDLDFYQMLLVATIIVSVILMLAILIMLTKIKATKTPSSKKKKKIQMPSIKKKSSVSQDDPIKASQKDLPDPGVIFKYSLAKENVLDKEIIIGQSQGNIKTYSTEVIDDHLTFFIRILDNSRDRDIYDLPDKIIEEYQLDFRRDGKVMIFYEGLDKYREMGSRERIYIKETPDETGEPTFSEIQAKQPIRFRVGDRLNQDGKFVNGYFEFHLFTQSYTVQTKSGIPKIEKNFMLRLYKIFPGYDTGSQNEDGLYPMVDPFTTGK